MKTTSGSRTNARWGKEISEQMSEIAETVLIVGAGPTGMMAALELSRFGIPVRLIDKTPEPATTSRAVGVQARTLELWQQRGMADSLVPLGNKGVAATSFADGKRIFRLEFKHTDSDYHYILFVSQAETERVLRETLDRSGVKVERSTALVAFAQGEESSGVTAVLQHGDESIERFPCSYMIAAEGAHSIVRATLGLSFEGKSLEEQYALGDLYVDGDIVDSDLQTFSSEHGFLGLFPMGNRRFRLIASNPISKPSKDTEPSLEELQQIYDQRSHLPARFRDMSWSSWFHINSRMIHRMNVGKVFLGGDSAHIHSPSGAQGMNTGMQDMINLGWKLALVIKGEAKPELLGTYTAERVPIIRNVLTKTEGLTKIIGSENEVFRALYTHIAPWLVGIEFVQENSTERMSQLALNYRDSSLSVSDGHSGNLRSGDRMPDLPVTLLNREGSAEQNPTPATVFGLLDPSTFTLFYSNITDPARTHSQIHGAIGSWHYLMRGHQIAADKHHRDDFQKLFGDSSSILLVRPDGYIGFTGTEKSILELAKYCDQWFVSKPLPTNKKEQHA